MIASPDTNALNEIFARNLRGEACGVYAVCSAHPWVIDAAIAEAKASNSVLLIEATANQVNQFGGYTGMQPADFHAWILSLTDAQGLAREQVVLGGDHLGPVCWKQEPAAQAMQKACDLVAAYVAAGFTKIHLDASMACADDVEPLSDEIIAARAARMCAIAEQTAVEHFGRSNLCYVVGTEVPAPGGVANIGNHLAVTAPAAVRHTLRCHEHAFTTAGLQTAWSRVIAIVVQPGVEFDNDSVHAYQPEAAIALRDLAKDLGGRVYEAHSTDYQPVAAYSELLRDHFAILKVGPQLTFALREALYALSHIEEALLPAEHCSGLRLVCEQVMCDEPKYWRSFYQGDVLTNARHRHFSYSDRIRYYWKQPAIENAVATLMHNLTRTEIPDGLLSQYLPQACHAVINEGLPRTPQALVQHSIRQITRRYARACTPHYR